MIIAVTINKDDFLFGYFIVFTDLNCLLCRLYGAKLGCRNKHMKQKLCEADKLGVEMDISAVKSGLSLYVRSRNRFVRFTPCFVRLEWI